MSAMNGKTATVDAISIECDQSTSFSSKGSIPLISPTNSCESQQQQQQRQPHCLAKESTHIFYEKQQQTWKEEDRRNAPVRENTCPSHIIEEAQAPCNNTHGCVPGGAENPRITGSVAAQKFSVVGDPIVVTPSGPSRKPITTSPVAGPAASAQSRLFSPSTLTAPSRHHIVYLIRHGQSRAQVSPKSQRLKDPGLQDCGLTNFGRQQAINLSNRYNLPEMDLVITSPLTRALETSILAFPSSSIVVHYELREIGRPDAPENTPRTWEKVLRDLLDGKDGAADRIDTESLRPTFPWPDHHNRTPTVLRRRYVQQHVIQWLAQYCELWHGLQPQPRTQHIALVCHFHVIRAALTDARGFCSSYLRPNNAEPIACMLTQEGRLFPIEDY